MNKPVFVIAEAGVNHNGDLARALDMIDVAAEAGADAVKFQSFHTDELVTAYAETAPYQATATGGETSQADMLRGLELDRDAHDRLLAHCGDRGVAFLSTPFDFTSLRMLADDLGLKTLKISSGDLTNGPFLMAAAQTGCDMIVSTGMGNLSEIAEGLASIGYGYRRTVPSTRSRLTYILDDPETRTLLAQKVTLLQCTSAYPTPYDEVNLQVMDTLAEHFRIPVGLSDHTLGIAVSVAAVARGACMIEKHFTLDRTLAGPDHAASLDPAQLTELVRSIRIVCMALNGETEKKPTPAEAHTARIARKSIVAARDIAAGEILTEALLALKRPGTGLSPMTYWDLLGTKTKRSYRRDEPIDRG